MPEQSSSADGVEAADVEVTPVEAGASESTDEQPEVQLSRAERRAAARGVEFIKTTRSGPVTAHGRNVAHDRSRYAVRRRG
jgi:hypothetical protein